MVKQGIEVTVLTRQKNVQTPVSGVKYVQFDFSERDDVLSKGDLLDDFDVFFHLASGVGEGDFSFAPNDYNTFSKEVTNPLLLMDNIGGGLEKIIFSSSVMVYPFFSTKPLKESEEDPESLYGVNKLVLEKSVNYWSKENNIDFISLRISQAYGAGMRVNRFLPYLIEQASADDEIEIFGDGSTTVDWVFIDDVKQALLLSVEYEGGGVFNVASGVGTTYLQLAEEVIDVCDSGSEISFLDKGVRPHKQVLDISKAKSELGFTPEYGLNKGLRCMLEKTK